MDAIYQLERWGLPFNRTPDGRIDQRRFGGHTRNHGEAPVRRACYAADRTGHMILQTLYQQCVKRDVKFFNELYCLDLLRADDGSTAGIVAYELGTGGLHIFRAKAVVFATGGYGRMFRVTSNAHALTGDGPALVWRAGPARGHGDVPVPPDRPGTPRRPAVGGGPRRGRRRPERRGRAFHGALRAHHQGPRAARHGQPRDLPGDQGRTRRRPHRRVGLPGHLAPRSEGDRREAPRHHRVRADLPEGRAEEGAGPDPADRALRDGRDPD